MARWSPPTGQDVSPKPIPSARILVVDDYEPWRPWVCSLLAAHEHLHVVGDVADGLEAVQRAQVLKPDLILLDIGLPTLNGIEAVHQIAKLVPEAKVVFVTGHNDSEFVTAALSNGACGYILKEEAASELLPAIEAVLGDAEVSLA